MKAVMLYEKEAQAAESYLESTSAFGKVVLAV
jgi:hypothetical protein